VMRECGHDKQQETDCLPEVFLPLALLIRRHPLCMMKREKH
jgi:hypothetical protein